MKDETSAMSYAEVVRNALRVYEWVLEQEKEGYDIGLIKDDQPPKIVRFVF